MADAVSVIQATLAPIFLVSGAAIFLNFTQARLFRVVDRLRALGGELSKVGEPKRRADLLHQRQRAIRRAIILRNAILFGVLVIALTVLTTLLILASALDARFDPGRMPILAFAGGLFSFMIALTLVVADAFISVASAREAAQEFAEGLQPGER